MEMMKLILLSMTLVWVSGVVEGFTYEDKEVETEAGRRGMYERWRSHHKMEKISESQKEVQFKNFKSKLELVHNTNKMKKGYKLQLNAFAGMTHEELRSKYTGLKVKTSFHTEGDPFMYGNISLSDLPPRMDWREQNAVTPVKNQASCGSCYAFAACDAVEGLHAIKNKELLVLSPKEIVDCCPKTGGCEGGWMQDTYEYIAKNGGLTTFENYPYTPSCDACTVDKAKAVAAQVGGHEFVPTDDEEALLKAVAHQPVTVSVEVNEQFGAYKEGVYDAPCGERTDHAVLAVGYDETPEGVKYWIIKNSWGEDWGDKGYIKMIRGLGGKGICGIAQVGSYPTIENTGTKHHEGDPIVHSTEL